MRSLERVPSELQTTAKTCHITRTYTRVLTDKSEVHRTHEVRKITFIQLFLTRFVGKHKNITQVKT